MKRVKGGIKIIRGRLLTGTYQNKIQLFDGKFTTGYRITEMDFMPEDPHFTDEYLIKASTQPKSNIAEFDWGDVEEIAWGGYHIPIASRFGKDSAIDPENMIVRDLYLSAYCGGEAGYLNYMLTLEKYEFAAWDGAATMIKNESQSK